jgi:hypothetical protein
MDKKRICDGDIGGICVGSLCGGFWEGPVDRSTRTKKSDRQNKRADINEKSQDGATGGELEE